MRKLLITTSLAAGLALGAAGAATAAPIVYDFTSTGGSVVDLGGTEGYTAGTGTPTVTAYSAYYTPPGNAITRSGILVGNNRGTDEQGLGVCLGSTSFFGSCGPFGIADNPEIDASAREVVQLDISSLLAAGYNSIKLNADSATSGELLLTYGSGSASSLGTLLASISSANGDVSVTQNGNYLNFISNGGPNSSNDVLLHSLTADKIATPEPVSVAVLGVGLLGIGMTRRLRSKS